MMPSGAVMKTRNRREKLWSWIIRRISIAPVMIGKRANSEALPFSDSSTAPPISSR